MSDIPVDGEGTQSPVLPRVPAIGSTVDGGLPFGGIRVVPDDRHL